MIKATYKNNLREYEDFLKYTVYELNSGKKNILLLGICALVAFVVGLILMLIKIPAGWLFLLICGLFLMVLAFKVWGYKRGIEKAMKSIKRIEQAFVKVSNDYEFDEESFVFENKKQGKNEVFYKEVYAVRETDKFFYVYMSKNIAYIIKKQMITEGSAEELSTLFKNILEDKYKSKGGK